MLKMFVRSAVTAVVVVLLLVAGPLAFSQGKPPKPPGKPTGGTGGSSLAARVTALEQQNVALQAQVDALEAGLNALLGQVGTHIDDTAIHQPRYTDAEAVGAVGPRFSGDHADLTNVLPGQHHADQAPEVDELQDLLVHFSRDQNEIFITGANLHVANGLGDTRRTNALGNVIIGYNEPRAPNDPNGPDDRTGSHMLVVGENLNYTSVGGIVVGLLNATNGLFSSVTGGTKNTASGWYSAISGGNFNTASGIVSSVSGGQQNAASGHTSSASGGLQNNAIDQSSSVSGGRFNLPDPAAPHLDTHPQ